MLEKIKNRIFPKTNSKYTTEGYIRQIDLDKLEPMMVKQDISEKDIIKLADNICKNGILFPVPVYTDGNTYKYINGSRRIAASMLLGRKSILCHVYTSLETSDNLLIASILHEKTPNPFEIYSLIRYFERERQMSLSDISYKLSIPQNRINNLLELEIFTHEERRMLKLADLSEDGIVELSKLTDKSIRNAVIERLYTEKTHNRPKIRGIIHELRADQGVCNSYDTKIIDNSFNRLVQLIKNLGKNAKLKKKETDTSTSYTITVQKLEHNKHIDNVSRETLNKASS